MKLGVDILLKPAIIVIMKTAKENPMNMSCSQYQTALALNEFLEEKENLDFVEALKEHDITLEELIANV